MSMVTLTIASAMFTQYWGPGFGLAPATFIMLTVMMLMNACGVRVCLLLPILLKKLIYLSFTGISNGRSNG